MLGKSKRNLSQFLGNDQLQPVISPLASFKLENRIQDEGVEQLRKSIQVNKCLQISRNSESLSSSKYLPITG